MLSFVVYCSRAVLPAGHPAEVDIVRTARAHNPDAGLTGFLHREADHYFQFIEGSPDPLAAVFERIERDRRHDSVRMLGRGGRQTRLFGGWAMGRVEPGPVLLDGRGGPVGLAAIRASDVVAFLLEAASRQASGHPPRADPRAPRSPSDAAAEAPRRPPSPAA